MKHLKLVHSYVDEDIKRPNLVPPIAQNTSLSMEALILESWMGKNLYSDFLHKHQERPNKRQAEVIACLMDARLRDKAGNLQPPLSKCARALHVSDRDKKKAKARSWQVLSTIVELSQQSSLEPAIVIDHSTRFSDRDTIRAQVRAAIEWLTRFDSELQARESETVGTT